MLANEATALTQPLSLSPVRKSAVVLGAALGLGAGYSAAYFGTLAVFLKPIAANYNWSRAEAET